MHHKQRPPREPIKWTRFSWNSLAMVRTGIIDAFEQLLRRKSSHVDYFVVICCNSGTNWSDNFLFRDISPNICPILSFHYIVEIRINKANRISVANVAHLQHFFDSPYYPYPSGLIHWYQNIVWLPQCSGTVCWISVSLFRYCLRSLHHTKCDMYGRAKAAIDPSHKCHITHVPYPTMRHSGQRCAEMV